MKIRGHSTGLMVTICVCGMVNLCAADWPMWRYDAQRSGVSSAAMLQSPKLIWSRQLPPTTPAFHSTRLQFDAGYEPVSSQGLVLVASSVTDSVTAYEASSGEQVWRFFTDGPVRMAPAISGERVCFGSDDGYLYCVNLADGKLQWKHKATPSSRRLLGNGRLISVWPVRGGPVVVDSVVYFAAGVWPFEGVFVYALNIETGEVLWRNDALAYRYGTQPHNTEAIGGLAPQGYLVVHGDQLVVPCSTAYPARLNRHTGELIEFELPAPGRYPGGWFAAVDKTSARAIRRGELTFDDVINRQQHEDNVRKGAGVSGISRKITLADQTIEFDSQVAGVEEPIHAVIAAQDKLIVTTKSGRLLCFAESDAHPSSEPRQWRPDTDHKADIDPSMSQQVEQLLASAASRLGYAIVLGGDREGLVDALIRASQYHVIMVEEDPQLGLRLRRKFVASGLYGSRVVVLQADPSKVELPPYLATLLVSEHEGEGASISLAQSHTVRPYGGIAAISNFDSKLGVLVDQQTYGEVESKPVGDWQVIRRVGALPGATDYEGGWTPNADELVRFPLGVLWFDDTLAHFKRSPQPKFIGGVMISQPKDWHAKRDPAGNGNDYPLLPTVLSDMYTGRVLADSEMTLMRSSLPGVDPNQWEPSQYRPPRQTDAWKPSQPVVGTRVNPMTGQSEARAFPKTYGCDGGVDYGGLYTLRSGTPAYYDKTLESGTVFLSGPRSGCTNSIIPAGGLLNVPYFFEGCTCSYPLPVAMSLVAMPESHEQWSCWGETELAADSIQRVGINFGAPGDRMTRDGTLWLDVPSVGGPSPILKTQLNPQAPVFHYQHSMWMQSQDRYPWVAASAVEGLTEFRLGDLKPGSYTVRLFFAEPHDSKPGDRVQDILIQQEHSIRDWDIIAATGGTMRSVEQEIREVQIDGEFVIHLSASAGKTLLSGIELIRDP